MFGEAAMIPAIFTRKLFVFPKPDWRIWLGISLPLAIYLLFLPYDYYSGDYLSVVPHNYGDDSDMCSDWNVVVDSFQLVIRNLPYCPISYSFFVLCDELTQPFMHAFCIPLVVGFYGQYVVMLMRYVFRRRMKAKLL
jgi:hypothetical protein